MSIGIVTVLVSGMLEELPQIPAMSTWCGGRCAIRLAYIPLYGWARRCTHVMYREEVCTTGSESNVTERKSTGFDLYDLTGEQFLNERLRRSLRGL